MIILFCCSCLNRADIIKVFDGETNLAPTITVLCNEGSGNVFLFNYLTPSHR